MADQTVCNTDFAEDEMTVALPADPSARPADKGHDRWTVRGVTPTARERATKAAALRQAPLGQWVSEAILAQWEAERSASRMPVVLAEMTPATTALHPSPAFVALAEGPLDHITICHAILPFTGPEHAESIRKAAERIIVQRLKLTGIAKPGQTRAPQSAPQSARLADEKNQTGGRKR